MWGLLWTMLQKRRRYCVTTIVCGSPVARNEMIVTVLHKERCLNLVDVLSPQLLRYRSVWCVECGRVTRCNSVVARQTKCWTRTFVCELFGCSLWFCSEWCIYVVVAQDEHFFVHDPAPLTKYSGWLLCAKFLVVPYNFAVNDVFSMWYLHTMSLLCMPLRQH